jgi:hypothetical protein
VKKKVVVSRAFYFLATWLSNDGSNARPVKDRANGAEVAEIIRLGSKGASPVVRRRRCDARDRPSPSQRTSGATNRSTADALGRPSHPRQGGDVEPICARRSWAEPKAGAERRLMLSQRR